MSKQAIRFGTDGWRGVIADDFTFDRVALVGDALEHYLQESGQADRPLLIGYDRRFAAEAYAAHLANHLDSLGRAVIVHDEPVPTPVIAFGVLHHEAAGAVQLTASHNPFYYQGLKFIPHFAGPALPETTDRITALLEQLAGDFQPPPLRMKWEGASDNLREAYFSHLDTVVNAHSLASSGWRVLYNPMHGVGAGYVDGYLERAGMEVLAINSERDVYFGGGMPDPSPANLTPLATTLVEDDCQLLVGTDGDADRFGLVDPAGRYYGANHALPLLADYLVTYRKLQGDVVRTVATSHLLDDVAADHSLKLIETAVGFKYVGAKLREGALIGGEESGGLSVKGHIPEKDGILASVLMLEMVATRGESLDAVYAELLERYGPRDYVRIDQQLPEADKQRLLSRLAEYDGDKFAGKKIERRVTIDGHKFIFSDKSWVMLRASGTEPVVRIYIETTAPETFTKWRNQILDEVKKLLK